MQSRLNPYINFMGDARQALTFYQDVFGGELALQTYAEFGAAEDPQDARRIMHGRLEAANGITIMGADAPSVLEDEGSRHMSMISLSLTGQNEAELRGYWDKLSRDGEVTMQLSPQVWGDTFGMCVDKFGVAWMVNIARLEGEA